MKLKVPESMEEKLENMEATDKERLKKKLNEIDQKISELGIEPGKVIEKRLKGPLHPLLQQRVGDWRLWFKEDREKGILWLEAVKRKEEAEKYY
ncbi:MAG: type II toxin-antitoxin system RelE/ParE family toxin [Candidatus Aenigmatarchaeota archaeon]